MNSRVQGRWMALVVVFAAIVVVILLVMMLVAAGDSVDSSNFGQMGPDDTRQPAD